MPTAPTAAPAPNAAIATPTAPMPFATCTKFAPSISANDARPSANNGNANPISAVAPATPAAIIAIEPDNIVAPTRILGLANAFNPAAAPFITPAPILPKKLPMPFPAFPAPLANPFPGLLLPPVGDVALAPGAPPWNKPDIPFFIALVTLLAAHIAPIPSIIAPINLGLVNNPIIASLSRLASPDIALPNMSDIAFLGSTLNASKNTITLSLSSPK